MLNLKPGRNPVTEEITRIVDRMSKIDQESEEYNDLLKTLSTLMALKTEHGRKRVSPDVVIGTVGQALLVLIIVAYEQKHVFTTKSLGFIGKKL